MTTVGSVGLDGIEPVLAQYDPGERWNGWLCPSVDAHAVVTILDALNSSSPDGPVYAYDFVRGVLFLEDLHDPEMPIERVEPDADGLYPLGAGAWVWSTADEAELKRHLSAVPDLPEIACMYADSGDGPCGGQATQRGDGFDYCMNHSELRLSPSTSVRIRTSRRDV